MVKRVFVIVAAISLMAAACGGGTVDTTGSASNAGTESSSAGSIESPGENTNSDGVDLGEDGVLTLEDFIPGGSPNYDEIDWREQELATQQKVAECMAAEGFEYIPYVPSDVGGGFIGEEWDEETWVRENGFGVATWIVNQDRFIQYEEEAANDPNNAIVEAMDELEREEYYRLLHGGEPEIIENTPWEEIEAMTPEEQQAFYDEAYRDWEPDGCYNTAWNDSFNQDAAQAFYEEFSDDLEAVYSDVESDPRIVEAQNSWSSCMAEAGYNYSTQEEMYGYFHGDEFGQGEFSLKVDALITYPEYTEEEMESFTEEQLNDPELWQPQFDINELQPLIDEEIAVATANYQCSQSIQDIWTEVYEDLQQQFLDDNMDRLLAYLEANS